MRFGSSHSTARPTFWQETQPATYTRGRWLSRYDEMILEIDKKIPAYYFLAAGCLSWLLLAGFLVSPSTYASLKDSEALDSAGHVGKSLMSAVRNVPLLYVASFACLFATVGLGWVWWKWRHNYIWINRQVFIPTLMNSTMGLVSTFLNVYGMHDGQWSITAIITGSIIGAWFVAALSLYVTYDHILLPRLKEIRWMALD